MKARQRSILLFVTAAFLLFSGCGDGLAAPEPSAQREISDPADSRSTMEAGNDAAARYQETVPEIVSYVRTDVRNTCFSTSGDMDYILSVPVTYSQLTVSEESVLYPGLTEAIKALNETWKQRMTEEFSSLADEAESVAESLTDEERSALLRDHHMEPDFSLNDAVYLRRLDDRVFSVLYEMIIHKRESTQYVYWGASYDLQSERMLKLSDIIADEEMFFKLAVMDPVTDELAEQIRNISNEMIWTLDADAVTIYVPVKNESGQLIGQTAHAFSIPLEMASGAVNETYCHVPDEYAVAMPSGIQYRGDPDHNGETDFWTIYRTDDPMPESGIERQYSLYWNLKEIWVLSQQNLYAVWMHTTDGENVLLLGLKHPFDSREDCTYCWKPGTVPDREASVVPYSWYSRRQVVIDSFETTTGTVLPVLPSAFLMGGVYPGVLSAYDFSHMEGYQIFRVSDSGIPIAENSIFEIEYNPKQRDLFYLECTLQDLELEVIDRYGVPTGQRETLPKGSRIQFVRSDGRDFLDIYSPQKYYRAAVTRSWDQIFVNGLPVLEVFGSTGVAE